MIFKFLFAKKKPLPLAGNGFGCKICAKRKPSASPFPEGNNYPDNYGDGHYILLYHPLNP
jgi:hypothetical protein